MALDADATAPTPATPAQDVVHVRLVCLVRHGDGYLLRAVGELPSGRGPGRRHLDITFGDAADRTRAGELDAAVRQVQRWCDTGTVVAMLEAGSGVALRAPDGTELALPNSS